MNARKLLDWRKLLIYSHRWLGMVLGLVFLVWFVSGIFFMYWGMPHLTAEERLMRMKPLDVSSVYITPGDAIEYLQLKEPRRLRIAMLGQRPVYRILTSAGWVTLYADTGESLRGMNALHATNTLRHFLPEHAMTIRYEDYLADSDQWTLQSVVRDLMPLHKIALNDDAGTYYYVSEKTGEPVLKTDSAGRTRGYLSAVLHWLYFTPFRRHTEFWNKSIVSGSLIGCVMCLSGLVIGIWRYSLGSRFRIKKIHSHSPYAGMMKWHHYAGLLFGVFTFTWALSGALSLGPFPFLRGAPATKAQREAVAGGAMNFKPLTANRIREAVAAISTSFVPKELEFLQFRGEPYFIAYRPPSLPEADQWKHTSISDFLSLQLKRDHVIVSALQPGKGLFKRFSDQEAFDVACDAMPGVEIQDSAWLDEYDAYYYSQHGTQPLPVLRVRFKDPQQTWLYVNPQHGQMIRYDRMSRLNRWLYKGLHDLDFPFLAYRRPLWDISVIVLSIGGILLSVTTLLPAFRRLRRHAKKIVRAYGAKRELT
jgi:hypothetical protein